jgi:hypothetical protein
MSYRRRLPVHGEDTYISRAAESYAALEPMLVSWSPPAMTARPSLTTLRERAERCLADPCPTPEEAHVLAALVLEALRALEFPADTPAHPYRGAAAPVHDGGSAGSADSAGSAPKPPAREADVRTLVALERALDECQARLLRANAEIAALRSGARSP